jgi:hypothetical protein
MEQKNAEEIKTICEEYCDEVEKEGSDVACLVHEKYLPDLKKRVGVHGWAIISLKRKSFLYYVRFFNLL